MSNYLDFRFLLHVIYNQMFLIFKVCISNNQHCSLLIVLRDKIRVYAFKNPFFQDCLRC